MVWLSDGGRGLWGLFDECFATCATGILGFYHAAQHLWKGATAWLDGRTSQARRWFVWARPRLRHGMPDGVLADLADALEVQGAARVGAPKGLLFFLSGRRAVSRPISRPIERGMVPVWSWGGRAQVRTTRSRRTLGAVQDNPVRKVFSERLRTAGKAATVALTAGRRTLLTILNAMVKHQTRWQPQEVRSASQPRLPLTNKTVAPLVPRCAYRRRLRPGVDMICIATDCAKRTSTTTFHSLLAQALSKSSDFMICVPFANHRV